MTINKMHVFLAGDFQVGKSTLIRNVLKDLPIHSIGGFCTISVADIPDAYGSVYIVNAVDVFSGENISFTEENRVGIRGNEGPIGFPEVFDRYGVAALADAGNCDLIIMDEIGKMERNSPAFISRVLEVLGGDVPVLGVLRKEGNTPLQMQIRNHPNVQMIEVTEENREQLLPELSRMMRERLMSRRDSGGAFVYRQSDEGIEILMIRGKGGWGFPKGHVEEGEDLKQAAVREVSEETGIEIRLEGDFSFTTPSARKDEKRNVTYFIGKAIGGVLTPQLSEVKSARWVPLEYVMAMIQFDEDVTAWQAALEVIAAEERSV